MLFKEKNDQKRLIDNKIIKKKILFDKIDYDGKKHKIEDED